MVYGGEGALEGGVNTPVCGGLGMFWVGDTDGAVVDCAVVVVGVAVDVVAVVAVGVAGLLVPLLPHAVSAPAAMIVTAATAEATAFDPALISVVLSSTDCWRTISLRGWRASI